MGPSHPTPRRGPPAIFVSCESGRERKCQREALELLHHYYYLSRPSIQTEGQLEDKPPAAEKTLTLEEELTMLRKGAAAEEVLSYEQNAKRPRTATANNASRKQITAMKSPFSVYDTGMRGMVCILCILPGSELIPYDNIVAEIRASKGKDNDDSKTGEESRVGGIESNSKHQVSIGTEEDHVDKRAGDDPPGTNAPLWDPVDTVKCILRDAAKANKGSDTNNNLSTHNDGSVSKEIISSQPPGSRFISRILPMQTTVSSVSQKIFLRFVKLNIIFNHSSVMHPWKR